MKTPVCGLQCHNMGTFVVLPGDALWYNSDTYFPVRYIIGLRCLAAIKESYGTG